MAGTPEDITKLFTTLKFERQKKAAAKTSSLLANFDKKSAPVDARAAAERAAALEEFKGVVLAVMAELDSKSAEFIGKCEKFKADSQKAHGEVRKGVDRLAEALRDAGSALGDEAEVAADGFIKQIDGWLDAQEKEFLKELAKVKAATSQKVMVRLNKQNSRPLWQPPAAQRPPPPALAPSPLKCGHSPSPRPP